jgi:hypothetical protein
MLATTALFLPRSRLCLLAGKCGWQRLYSLLQQPAHRIVTHRGKILIPASDPQEQIRSIGSYESSFRVP